MIHWNKKKTIKATKVAVLLIMCAVFITVLFYEPSPKPIIKDVQPLTVREGEHFNENNVITISGSLFSEDVDVYMDGLKLEGLNRISDQEIAFSLPEFLFKEGKRKVQVVNDGMVSRKSNKAVITVLAQGDYEVPSISKVEITKTFDLFASVSIRGENFSIGNSGVVINGQVQNRVIVDDENQISAIIDLSNFYLDEKLNFKVTDSSNEAVYSEEYVVNNDNRLDTDIEFASSMDYLKKGSLIAHAFGGYEGQTYTNSKEAFLYNYKEGHRIFEVDMQFTSDGVLATLHDREGESIQSFDVERKNQAYTILSFEELCLLMKEYKDCYFVTDTKYHDNYTAIKNTFDRMTEEIHKVDPSLMGRIVVQVYNQKMYYYMVNNYEFKSYIYTLYMSPDTDEQVVDFVKRTGIPVVTMWDSRATQDFVSALKEVGASVFAHTVNEVPYANELLERGVYGIYTDFIKKGELVPETLAKRLNNGKEDKNPHVMAIPKQTMESLTHDALQALTSLGLAPPKGKEIDDYYIAVWNKGKREGEFNSLESFRNAYPNQEYVSHLEYGLSRDEYKENAVIVISYPNETDRYVECAAFHPDNGMRKDELDVSYLNNRQYFTRYLEQIDWDRQMVVLSAMDDASNAIDDELQAKLHAFGLKEDIQGKFRYGYAAILNHGQSVYEELSLEAIDHQTYVEEYAIRVFSAGNESGNRSSIVINNAEYSMNRRGLNMVIIDKTTGTVMDSVCFDTCEGLGSYRN